jgi:hypothetical protein
MGSPVNPVPLPYTDPIAKPKPVPGLDLRPEMRLSEVIRYLEAQKRGVYLTDTFLEYFSQQAQLQAETTSLAAPVFEAEDQTASIAATDVSDGALAEGYYEFVTYATVVRAAGTSMSLTVTHDYTDNGQTKSESEVTTTNATTTILRTGGLIHIDNASPVRVAVTYGSVGAPTMSYDVRSTLRRVA